MEAPCSPEFSRLKLSDGIGMSVLPFQVQRRRQRQIPLMQTFSLLLDVSLDFETVIGLVLELADQLQMSNRAACNIYS